MNNANKAVLHILLFAIALLFSLLVAVGAAALARHEGKPWATAIKQGSAGFAVSLTVVMGLYTTFALLP
ncbi:hypothetical protein [Nocardia brasiliensis]|uniref:hypothetical protein n=1 Tax=Nocardia brasiliensis TaxID=37326 RepID=UPI0024572600|nr:hypothetical protein [Nocardia brasiliensis]